VLNAPWMLGSFPNVVQQYNPRESPLPCEGRVVLVTFNYRLGLFGFLKVEGGDYNVG
jgi:carboxylesterase type B